MGTDKHGMFGWIISIKPPNIHHLPDCGLETTVKIVLHVYLLCQYDDMIA